MNNKDYFSPLVSPFIHIVLTYLIELYRLLKELFDYNIKHKQAFLDSTSLKEHIGEHNNEATTHIHNNSDIGKDPIAVEDVKDYCDIIDEIKVRFIL